MNVGGCDDVGVRKTTNGAQAAQIAGALVGVEDGVDLVDAMQGVDHPHGA